MNVKVGEHSIDTTIVIRTFTYIEERSFRMFVTYAHESVNDCNVDEILHEGHLGMRGLFTERYEAYEELE